MGKFSRKANKGKNYRTWNAGSVPTSQDSRQQRRALRRKQAIEQITATFGGESRKQRRILALDSLRKYKKGI